MIALTDHLKALACYSAKLDAGTISEGDFIDLQRLDAIIIDDYKSARFGMREYAAITALCSGLIDETRAFLKKNARTARGGKSH